MRRPIALGASLTIVAAAAPTAFDSTGAAAVKEVIGVRVIPPATPGDARPLRVLRNHIVTVEQNPRTFRPRGTTRSTVEAGCTPSAGIWDGPVDDASVRADASAPGFVSDAVDWLSRHGIGHVLG